MSFESIEEIVNSRNFQRLISAALAVEKFPAQLSQFGHFVISKLPERIAERNENRPQASAISSGQLSPDAIVRPLPNAFKSSAQLLIGLRHALEINSPANSETINSARQLLALSRKGLLSYTEILEALKAGSSPTTLISDGRLRSVSQAKRATEQSISVSESTSGRTVAPISESEGTSVFFASTKIQRFINKLSVTPPATSAYRYRNKPAPRHAPAVHS